MKKQTKIILWPFGPLDYTAMVEFLERKAQQGWLLEKVGRYVARFRAIEPQEVHYDVVVNASPGLCEASEVDSSEGSWQYVGGYEDLQFYYATSKIPHQPQQSLTEKAKGIIESKLVRNEIISLFTFVGLMCFYLMTGKFSFSYEQLLTFIGCALVVVRPVIVLIMAIHGGYFTMRIILLRKQLKRELPLCITTSRIKLCHYFVVYVMLLVLLIYILAGLIDILFGKMVMLVVFTTMSLGIGSGILIKNRFANKQHPKHTLIVMFVVILAVNFITMSMGISLLLQGQDRRRLVEIPNDKVIIQMGDLIQDNSLEINMNYWNEDHSPLVTNHYAYWALSKTYGSLRSNTYYTVHTYIAQIIYKGILTDLTKHGANTYDAKLDWQVDEAVYIANKEQVLVRDGLLVFVLDGDFDFSDPVIIDKVKTKLFNQ